MFDEQHDPSKNEHKPELIIPQMKEEKIDPKLPLTIEKPSLPIGINDKARDLLYGGNKNDSKKIYDKLGLNKQMMAR
jgi:hypothetical protein